MAHAGVLAAASLLLRKELEECDRGTYTIVTGFSEPEIRSFIIFAYTGIEMDPMLHRLSELYILRCDDNITHMNIVVSLLHQFATRGLFCNMARCRRHEDMEPVQSYVIAAKHPFFAEDIPKHSMVIARVGKGVGDNLTEKEISKAITTRVDPYQYTIRGVPFDKRKICNQVPENSFVCCICNRGFLDQPTFVSDELVHIQPKRNWCDACYRERKPHEPSHKLIAISQNWYMCPLCHTHFKTKG